MAIPAAARAEDRGAAPRKTALARPGSQRRCCEIRLRTERKATQIEKKQGKDKGGRSKKNLGREPAGLRAAGVSRDQAEQWRQLADVPDEQFEAALEQSEMPTTRRMGGPHPSGQALGGAL